MANTIVVPDVGKLTLAKIVNGVSGFPGLPGNCFFRLYQSVTGSLGPATVFANFTECTYTGYSQQTLVGASIDGIIPTDQRKVTYGSMTFQPTGSGGLPQTANGYFVQYVDSIVNEVCWCQAFAVPFTFNSTSDALTLTPELDVGQLA